MATLPEIESIMRQLDKEAVDKRIKDSWVSPAALVARHGTITDFCAQIEGARIKEVTRRGLAIILALDNDKNLVCVPGTRSRVTRKTANATRGQFTRFVFSFTTGGSMHYSDRDVDGAWFLASDDQIADLKEVVHRGLDPLAEAIHWPVLASELQRRRSPLYCVLIDPTFMIGVGEIYANEALFRSGLSPARKSETLSNQEVRRLQRSLYEVLQDALKDGGINAPMPDDADEYLEPRENRNLEIFDREGLPDRRSRALIEKIEVAEGVFAFKSASQS